MDTVRRIRTSKPGVVFVKPAHKIVWRGYLKPKDQREYLGGIDRTVLPVFAKVTGRMG